MNTLQLLAAVCVLAISAMGMSLPVTDPEAPPTLVADPEPPLTLVEAPPTLIAVPEAPLTLVEAPPTLVAVPEAPPTLITDPEAPSTDSEELPTLIPVVPDTETPPTLSPCTGSTVLEWLPHPTDCSLFYICWGSLHQQLSCGPDRSWQPDRKVCVIKGVVEGPVKDICTMNKDHDEDPNPYNGDDEPLSCEYGVTGIISHPLKCAQYYNCSDNSASPYWEEHVNECTYPMLFSKTTGRCEHYTQVDCGSRAEAKNPCDYQMNQCFRAHCIPCSIRHPDCTGFPDGDNLWKNKEESPYFCVCKEGRVVRSDLCPAAQIFHPEQRRCVDARSYFEKKEREQ